MELLLCSAQWKLGRGEENLGWSSPTNRSSQIFGHFCMWKHKVVEFSFSTLFYSALCSRSSRPLESCESHSREAYRSRKPGNSEFHKPSGPSTWTFALAEYSLPLPKCCHHRCPKEWHFYFLRKVCRARECHLRCLFWFSFVHRSSTGVRGRIEAIAQFQTTKTSGHGCQLQIFGVSDECFLWRNPMPSSSVSCWFSFARNVWTNFFVCQGPRTFPFTSAFGHQKSVRR